MSRDRAAANEMVRRTGQTGVPVIVVGDEAIVGFDQARLEQMLARAAGARPSLGLKVADASSQVGRVPSLAGRSGAYVGGVVPGSPAAAAGFQTGDLVVAVDGRPIGGAADLAREVAGKRGRVILTTIRHDQALQIGVNL